MYMPNKCTYYKRNTKKNLEEKTKLVRIVRECGIP